MIRSLVPLDATATKMPSSGDHTTDLQSLSAAEDLDAHSTPSADVMTRFPEPLLATATNRSSSPDHVTEVQMLSSAEERCSQKKPSAEVITLFPVPLLATATNKLRFEDHTTEFQLLSAAEERDTQVMPSEEVITLLPIPLLATAAKRWSSGAHATEVQSLSAADARDVHAVPLNEVMTRSPVPELATDTKILTLVPGTKELGYVPRATLVQSRSVAGLPRETQLLRYTTTSGRISLAGLKAASREEKLSSWSSIRSNLTVLTSRSPPVEHAKADQLFRTGLQNSRALVEELNRTMFAVGVAGSLVEEPEGDSPSCHRLH